MNSHLPPLKQSLSAITGLIYSYTAMLFRLVLMKQIPAERSHAMFECVKFPKLGGVTECEKLTKPRGSRTMRLAAAVDACPMQWYVRLQLSFIAVCVLTMQLLKLRGSNFDSSRKFACWSLWDAATWIMMEWGGSQCVYPWHSGKQGIVRCKEWHQKDVSWNQKSCHSISQIPCQSQPVSVALALTCKVCHVRLV